MSTPKPLTIVIVGGVAGGASAAARARRMNEHARIILYEKDDHVSFANCGLPYYLSGEIAERDKLLVVKPDLLRRRFNIEVNIRHEVRGIDPQAKQVTVLDRDGGKEFAQDYDKLILATGAAPLVPPLEGANAANVFTLRNVADADRIKAYLDDRRPQRAVVVGAGFIGLEMIEQLHRCGVRVALVELLEQVLPPLDPEMAHIVQTEMEANDVDVRVGDGVKAFRIGPGGVDGVELTSGATLDADVVILGIGVRPNVKLAEAIGLEIGATGGLRTNGVMQTCQPDIYAVGDMVEYVYGPTGQPLRMALAGPANRAGRIAGEHAARGAASGEMPSVLGTSIVRVFDKAAAMTGLGEKFARKLGRDATSVIITANNHVGYYPGAQPMVLKLIYEPKTGKVLGAQAVGGDGVDKRIDVIATAIQLGGSVRDLAGLDLAYAPPFGAAKDPIHMAAFAACNELDGIVCFLPSHADLDGMQILDVRFDLEVTTGLLPGAVHIPLDDLRERIGELDASQPTAVTCASGLRSYVATRILRQRGFEDVYNLSGGMSMRRHARPGELQPA